MKSKFSEYISEFLNFIKVSKNFSKNTLISYENDLKQLQKFLFVSLTGKDESKFESLAIDLNEIDINILKSFVSELFDKSNKLNKKPKNYRRDYSAKSISRKISTLKAFFKYLKRKKYVEKNVASPLIFPKQKKKIPYFFSQNEMSELLDDRKSIDLSLIDKAIIELFYSTGIRLSELINLKIGDVNFSKK